MLPSYEPLDDNTLTITAEFELTRHVVVFRHRYRIAIPNMQFVTLLVLVRARIRKSTGFASAGSFDADSKPALHQSIRRLRRDFDDVLGSKQGQRLIRHVGKSTYELVIPRSSIHVMPAIRDLVPDHIPAYLANDIITEEDDCQQPVR